MTNTGLGKRIRERRKELGLTQIELALRCVEVDSGYISMLETGKRSPTLQIINDIAQGLEITMAALLSGERFEPPHYNPGMNRLITYAAMLSPDDLDDLMKLAQIIFDRHNCD